MKKLFFFAALVLSVTAMSCKTMKSQKQQDSDLQAIVNDLKNSISDIDVSYLNGNIKIVLAEAIYFKTGSAELSTSAADKLDKIAGVINNYPKTKLDLTGYTDNVGTTSDNIKLSMDRANSVKNYLESRQVKAKRITTFGNGESAPVASNATAEGRGLNRRVEFVIHY